MHHVTEAEDVRWHVGDCNKCSFSSDIVNVMLAHFVDVHLVSSDIDIHCNQWFVDKQGVLSEKETVHPITDNYSSLMIYIDKYSDRKLSYRMKWGLNGNEMMTNDRNEIRWSVSERPYN